MSKMFNFFRRSKTNRKDSTNTDAEDHQKVSDSKSENKKKKQLSKTSCIETKSDRLPLTNDWESACASNLNVDKNKFKQKYADQHKKKNTTGDGVLRSVLEQVEKDKNNDIENENDYYMNSSTSKGIGFKEFKSSRNEFVDQVITDDKKQQYRNVNDQKRSIDIDRSCHQELEEEPQQQTFNPISKSRAFINVIMAKGRNRNRNRNKHNNNNIISKDLQQQQQNQQQHHQHGQNINHNNNQIDSNQPPQPQPRQRHNGNHNKQCPDRQEDHQEANYHRHYGSPNTNNLANFTEKIQCGSDQMSPAKNKPEIFTNYEVVKGTTSEISVGDRDCNLNGNVGGAATAAGNSFDREYAGASDVNPRKNRIPTAERLKSDESSAPLPSPPLANDDSVLYEKNTRQMPNRNYGSASDRVNSEFEVNFGNVSNLSNCERSEYDAVQDGVTVTLPSDEDDNDYNENEHGVAEDIADDDDDGQTTAAQQRRRKLPKDWQHRSQNFAEPFRDRRAQLDTVNEDDENIEEPLISELTECDRDRYYYGGDKDDMGQPQSKKIRQEHINWANNVVIPTITVADFSETQSANNGNSGNKSAPTSKSQTSASASSHSGDLQPPLSGKVSGNGNGDTDIFYDSTSIFDNDNAESNGQGKGATSSYQPLAKTATIKDKDQCIEIEDLLDVDDDDDNDDEENDDDEGDWPFVSSESELTGGGAGGSAYPKPDITGGASCREDSNQTGRNTYHSDFYDLTTNPSSNTSSNRENSTTSSNKSTLSNNDKNSSTTSFSSINSNYGNIKKSTDSPDSGIESVATHSEEYLIPITIERDSESYIRDSSTDCDEIYLPSDHDTTNDPRYYPQTIIEAESDDLIDEQQRHIIIDSISLPDVVVESTTGMGNNSVKVEPVDDRAYHHQQHQSTDSPNSPETAAPAAKISSTEYSFKDTRDLVNQEARYSAQLDDAQKIIYNAQSKINDLQTKIDHLEKELSIKSWNVDRLQAELLAAHKEDEGVRKRLRMIQDEMVAIKHKYSESEDDLNSKYDELETEHSELQEKYRQLQSLASTLQTQLAFAQSDTEQCRKEKEQLREEKDAELSTLKEALEKSQRERQESEEKWKKEFELLRTQNADHEEHLLTDCEWQLRNVQRTCKDKLELAVQAKAVALEKVSELEEKINEQAEQVIHFSAFEAEVKQLRGLTNDQRTSLSSMVMEINELKMDLLEANKQLEEEIQNVKKIRLQCDNALSEKDRKTVQRIEEARGEVAVMWEDRLMEEMTRLTAELESVHVDERRNELEKLQAEHLEEIKALTTRYDENEKELREEIKSLREKLETKREQLEELQTKTDYALVQTRMHLERADHDFQLAIDRESEKREKLAETLREEFEQEKLEMEEKFRERLGHVKEEFAQELKNATEEMAQKHRKQLEQQWEQLIAEKEEALQAMESRHRMRLEDADNRLKDIQIQHSRDLKEIKNNNDIERTTLESRDLQNSQEIEQLHRKCRCLTNLFEEMRMRYERREPRPEDLREIFELRERCESQERDLQTLTERLREIQLEQQEQQQIHPPPRKNKVKKPPPKTLPTSCDVIYEENEERESSPPSSQDSGLDKIASFDKDNLKLVLPNDTQCIITDAVFAES